MANSNQKFGSGLTDTGNPPLCDEEWALRSPDFGNYHPSFIANAYFSGGIFGPPVSPYKHSEHLFWLLSNSSDWLPENIHDLLLEGMASWAVWVWTNTDHFQGSNVNEDALINALVACGEKQEAFEWTSMVESDVFSRIDFAINAMNLIDSRDDIMSRFLEHDLVGKYLSIRQARRERNSQGEG